MKPPTPTEKTDIMDKFLDDEAGQNPEAHGGVFFKYYESLFRGPPGSSVVNVARPAYSSHAEVVGLFGCLIGNTSQTKADFSSLYATDVATDVREHGIRALLQASLMIDCALKQHLPEGHKVSDFVPQSWGEQQSFDEFVERCFPSPAQSQKVRQDSENPLAQRSRLTAWKLKEWHKLRLRPTDNLAEHLVFEPESSILHVFRQVGWLKAHLRRSQNEDIDTGFAESLKMYFDPGARYVLHSSHSLGGHYHHSFCWRSSTLYNIFFSRMMSDRTSRSRNSSTSTISTGRLSTFRNVFVRCPKTLNTSIWAIASQRC